MTHADAGDFEAALASFEEALAARERIGDPATIRVARWMIGWSLRNLGRRDEALAVQQALKAELDDARRQPTSTSTRSWRCSPTESGGLLGWPARWGQGRS